MGVVRHLVAPGDCVLDVGANFGFYTAFLSSLVGKDGRVFSFEPIPRTFDLLSFSIRKLPLSNVSAFKTAVSDQAGVATMEVPLFEPGRENFYQARLSGTRSDISRPDRLRVSVSLTTLDSVLPRISGTLSFVKIDVEGHEFQAINGATRLISATHPALLIEMSGDVDDPGSASHALVAQLDRRGYTAFWFDGTALRARAPGDQSINYFFLTERHCTALANKVRLAS